VVVGTRSAVFAPLRAPGILIVDEEHDPSFKQQDGFRYHARDLAVIRGQQLGIPVVLGSATPALESRHNAQRGRYRC
jgi:primosomal protein N' (replication factor Y)